MDAKEKQIISDIRNDLAKLMENISRVKMAGNFAIENKFHDTSDNRQLWGFTFLVTAMDPNNVKESFRFEREYPSVVPHSHYLDHHPFDVIMDDYKQCLNELVKKFDLNTMAKKLKQHGRQ